MHIGWILGNTTLQEDKPSPMKKQEAEMKVAWLKRAFVYEIIISHWHSHMLFIYSTGESFNDQSQNTLWRHLRDKLSFKTFSILLIWLIQLENLINNYDTIALNFEKAKIYSNQKWMTRTINIEIFFAMAM